MRRRSFLQFGVAAPMASTAAGRAATNGLYDPVEFAKEQLEELLGVVPVDESERELYTRDAAETIADWYTETEDYVGIIESGTGSAQVSFDWVRRVRKFYDVWDRAFGVTLPNLPIYRAFWTASQLTKIGSIFLAMKNLGEISLEITQTVAQKSVNAVTDAQYREFYIACALLAVESVIAFYFPLDFKVAWRGTRYITNRLLVRFRSVLGLRGYAFVMSEVHYLIRGIRGNITNNRDELCGLIEFIQSQSRELATEFEQFEMPSDSEMLSVVIDLADELSSSVEKVS